MQSTSLAALYSQVLEEAARSTRPNIRRRRPLMTIAAGTIAFSHNPSLRPTAPLSSTQDGAVREDASPNCRRTPAN